MSRGFTRQQISKGITYEDNMPPFLQRMYAKQAGKSVRNDDEDEDWDEWQASSGRPPIPRRPTPPERPAIPERPDDDPGSADEDDDDEKPQVVVLKEGKHMTARDAENERRKARGLSPIPDPNNNPANMPAVNETEQPVPAKPKKTNIDSLNFTSGSGPSKSTKKRKVITGDDDDLAATDKSATKKKSKKTNKNKGLLSFGDDG